MRIRNLIILLIILFLHTSYSCSTIPFDSYDDIDIAGVSLADPFIILSDTTYYAYGTYGGNGFYVYSSNDLINWYKYDAKALESKNSYGERDFWAPEVYFNETSQKYIMYYTAQKTICVAESLNAYGPFIQDEKKSNFNLPWAWDATLLQDDDKLYLYYVSEDSNGFQIWGSELTENSQKGQLKKSIKCIEANQSWEKENYNVTEGPCIIKYKNYYYMIYSGPSFESSNYSIGYAFSEHPLGPWKKYEHNPVLHKPLYNGKVLEGTGHGSIFTDKNGQLRLVFHAHKLPGVVEPRQMFITSVHFTDDEVPVLYFGDDIIRALNTPIE